MAKNGFWFKKLFSWNWFYIWFHEVFLALTFLNFLAYCVMLGVLVLSRTIFESSEFSIFGGFVWIHDLVLGEKIRFRKVRSSIFLDYVQGFAKFETKISKISWGSKKFEVRSSKFLKVRSSEFFEFDPTPNLIGIHPQSKCIIRWSEPNKTKKNWHVASGELSLNGMWCRKVSFS